MLSEASHSGLLSHSAVLHMRRRSAALIIKQGRLRVEKVAS
jgi:hypothetical protein